MLFYTAVVHNDDNNGCDDAIFYYHLIIIIFFFFFFSSSSSFLLTLSHLITIYSSSINHNLIAFPSPKPSIPSHLFRKEGFHSVANGIEDETPVNVSAFSQKREDPPRFVCGYNMTPVPDERKLSGDNQSWASFCM